MKISLTKSALFSKLHNDKNLNVKQLLISPRVNTKTRNLKTNTKMSLLSETKDKEYTRCFSNESMFPTTHLQTTNNIFNSTSCNSNSKSTRNKNTVQNKLFTSFTSRSMISTKINLRHNHKHEKHLFRCNSNNNNFTTKQKFQNRVNVLPKKVMEIYKKGIPFNELLHSIIPIHNIQKEIQAQSFPIISSKKMVKNMLPREYDYNRIKKPEEVIKDSYHNVVRSEKKLMNKHINAVNKLITHDYNSSFHLVPKNKFSEKYIKNETVHELEQNPKFIEMINSLINKNFKLKGEVSEVINTTNKQNDIEHKKKLYQRYKHVMIRAAIHFQKLDITIEEFYDRKKNINEISQYEYNKNTLLIRAIKAKDLERITKIVKENSFIVLDCDMVSKIY
jgi:hypothetical protein